MSNIPKIILMLEPLGGYVKGILEGILKYSNIYGPWAFYREPEGLHGILPYLDMKKADGMIGFVSETKYKDHAKKIIKSGIPTIAIEYEEQIEGLPEIKCDSYAVGKTVADDAKQKLVIGAVDEIQGQADVFAAVFASVFAGVG